MMPARKPLHPFHRAGIPLRVALAQSGRNCYMDAKAVASRHRRSCRAAVECGVHRRLLASLAIGLGFLAGGVALASDVPAKTAPPAPAWSAALAEEGWIVTFGANLSAAPSYLGSSTRTLQVLPDFSFRRAGEAEGFSAPDDGFDFAIFDKDWLKAGPVAKFVSARSASGNPELAGLRFIDWALEAGAFVELHPVERLRARLELRQGVNGHKGIAGSLGADWIEKLGSVTFALGPRLAFGSGQYMRTYFSVSPAEAFASGRVASYRARGGIASLGAAASASYAYSPQWTGTVYAGYDRLVENAGRSPVPRLLGSRDQFILGTVLSRSFLFKGL